jgi:hypothetical protein
VEGDRAVGFLGGIEAELALGCHANVRISRNSSRRPTASGRFARPEAKANMAWLVVDGAGEEQHALGLDQVCAELLHAALVEPGKGDGACHGLDPVEYLSMASEERFQLGQVAVHYPKVALNEEFSVAQCKCDEVLARSAGADRGVVLTTDRRFRARLTLWGARHSVRSAPLA